MVNNVPMRYKVPDDSRITMGHLELELAFGTEHLLCLRILLFYISKMRAFIYFSTPQSPDRDNDIKTLEKLHEELCNMQRKIVIGNGENREQWKSNLARISEIQMIASTIAVKYDLVCYEVAQFAEFNK